MKNVEVILLYCYPVKVYFHITLHGEGCKPDEGAQAKVQQIG